MNHIFSRKDWVQQEVRAYRMMIEQLTQKRSGDSLPCYDEFPSPPTAEEWAEAVCELDRKSVGNHF